MDQRTIEQAEPADLPAIIAELHRLAALALARLVTSHTCSATLSQAPEPALLTVTEAAAFVSLSPVALRRSAKFKSARRKLGHRLLRFDRDALLRIVRRAA